MRFALITPIVASIRNEWEYRGTGQDLIAIAKVADSLGFEYLTCCEHVAIPDSALEARGSRFYDPLATFGLMAAVTRRVRFMTHVLVLPYHHPIAIAKRYGTLDQLSDGRLMLGVGVGTLEEEFDLLGVDFADRGTRYTEALDALRASLSGPRPEFHGRFYDFSGIVVDPCPIQERVPIWLGGKTPLSLRRALVSGDGWNPSLPLERVREIVSQGRDWAEWSTRSAPLEVGVLFGESDITAPGGEEGLVEEMGRAREAGATVLNVKVRSRSLYHYLEQITGIAERLMPKS